MPTCTQRSRRGKGTSGRSPNIRNGFHISSPSPHVAPCRADIGTRLGGPLEMAGRSAHQNGVAPPDGNDALELTGTSVSVALIAMMRYHREKHQDDRTRP